jgi:hypothetical protein
MAQVPETPRPADLGSSVVISNSGSVEKTGVALAEASLYISSILVQYGVLIQFKFV